MNPPNDSVKPNDAVEAEIRLLQQSYGLPRDTAEVTALDLVEHAVPAPSSEAVENERIARAQAEEAKKR